MKWFISLIALYGALAAASPENTKTIYFPDAQDEVGVEFLDIQEEGGFKRRRGICTTNSQSCCCQCAASDAWPCIGCYGVSNPEGEEKNHSCLLLMMSDHSPRSALLNRRWQYKE
ncbi:hypothetical protein V8C35DRAFT_23515 [Trichoderma chlorosporum]